MWFTLWEAMCDMVAASQSLTKLQSKVAKGPDENESR